MQAGIFKWYSWIIPVESAVWECPYYTEMIASLAWPDRYFRAGALSLSVQAPPKPHVPLGENSSLATRD